jgi:hypothetical protein
MWGRGQTNLKKKDCSKITALAGLYDNPIPTQFLAPIDCSKNRSSVQHEKAF